MTTIAEHANHAGEHRRRAPLDRAPGPAPTSQDRFLKLLVTQMKNQDPLNPLDNAQVTTQLAQINTVSGIEQLNTTLQSMAAASSPRSSRCRPPR